MRAWLRRRWNEIAYGSPGGPAIAIDWDRQVVTYLNMSPRLVVRLERWRSLGEQYRPRGSLGEQHRQQERPTSTP